MTSVLPSPLLSLLSTFPSYYTRHIPTPNPDLPFLLALPTTSPSSHPTWSSATHYIDSIFISESENHPMPKFVTSVICPYFEKRWMLMVSELPRLSVGIDVLENELRMCVLRFVENLIGQCWLKVAEKEVKKKRRELRRKRRHLHRRHRRGKGGLLSSVFGRKSAAAAQRDSAQDDLSDGSSGDVVDVRVFQREEVPIRCLISNILREIAEGCGCGKTLTLLFAGSAVDFDENSERIVESMRERMFLGRVPLSHGIVLDGSSQLDVVIEKLGQMNLTEMIDVHLHILGEAFGLLAEVIGKARGNASESLAEVTKEDVVWLGLYCLMKTDVESLVNCFRVLRCWIPVRLLNLEEEDTTMDGIREGQVPSLYDVMTTHRRMMLLRARAEPKLREEMLQFDALGFFDAVLRWGIENVTVGGDVMDASLEVKNPIRCVPAVVIENLLDDRGLFRRREVPKKTVEPVSASASADAPKLRSTTAEEENTPAPVRVRTRRRVEEGLARFQRRQRRNLDDTERERILRFAPRKFVVVLGSEDEAFRVDDDKILVKEHESRVALRRQIRMFDDDIEVEEETLDSRPYSTVNLLLKRFERKSNVKLTPTRERQVGASDLTGSGPKRRLRSSIDAELDGSDPDTDDEDLPDATGDFRAKYDAILDIGYQRNRVRKLGGMAARILDAGVLDEEDAAREWADDEEWSDGDMDDFGFGVNSKKGSGKRYGE